VLDIHFFLSKAPPEDGTSVLKHVKVKLSLEQAMKAQRGSRGTALLFL
jgi:hypothetical protein